jgi:hypothetical protein
MTDNEKVILQLKVIKALYEEKMKDGDIGIAINYDTYVNRAGALYTAINALEKQTPLKPMVEIRDGFKITRCPNCGCNVSRNNNYCAGFIMLSEAGCGQPLDWGE